MALLLRVMFTRCSLLVFPDEALRRGRFSRFGTSALDGDLRAFAFEVPLTVSACGVIPAGI
jgi:hypothetical protein